MDAFNSSNRMGKKKEKKRKGDLREEELEQNRIENIYLKVQIMQYALKTPSSDSN